MSGTIMTVSIRPIVLEDFPSVLEWSRDERFCSANGWDLNRNPEELRQWWQGVVNGIAEDFIRLGIDYEGKLIGYVDFAEIKKDAAEFGIAIGDSSLWGMGIGLKAAQAAIDYAAQLWGITNFYAETHETNLRSRRLLEKIGFQEISRIGTEEYRGQVTQQLIQLRSIHK